MGLDCLDLMDYIRSDKSAFTEMQKVDLAMCFQKVKSEFRCEKLLMLYMLNKTFGIA